MLGGALDLLFLSEWWLTGPVHGVAYCIFFKIHCESPFKCWSVICRHELDAGWRWFLIQGHVVQDHWSSFLHPCFFLNHSVLKKKKRKNPTKQNKQQPPVEVSWFLCNCQFQWPCPSTLISVSLSAACIRRIKTVHAHMYRCPSVSQKKDFDFSPFYSGLTPSFVRCDVYVCVCVHAQSCLTHCYCMDCSPPGLSVHGKFQVRILEWVATSYSRGSSQPRDRTLVSWSLVSPTLAGGFFTTEPAGKSLWDISLC